MTEPNGWLDKVSKLLAMAERTDNPAEAEAFSAKAEQLMVTYAIDQAMLDAARKPEEREKVIAVKMKIYAPYAPAKTILVHNVADVFNVKTVYTETTRYSANDPAGIQTLIGFTSDVEKVELLVTSLLIQQTRAVGTARPPYRSNVRSFRAAFARGFASEVIARVRQVYAEAKKEAASTGTDLVLLDRKAVVNREYEEMFPNRFARKSGRISNAVGYNSGRVAGERADLGQTRMGTTSRIGIQN